MHRVGTTQFDNHWMDHWITQLDEHLGFFQLKDFMNKVAMNVLVKTRCGHVSLFLLGKYPEVALLSHMACGRCLFW